MPHLRGLFHPEAGTVLHNRSSLSHMCVMGENSWGSRLKTCCHLRRSSERGRNTAKSPWARGILEAVGLLVCLNHFSTFSHTHTHTQTHSSQGTRILHWPHQGEYPLDLSFLRFLNPLPEPSEQLAKAQRESLTQVG